MYGSHLANQQNIRQQLAQIPLQGKNCWIIWMSTCGINILR